MARGGPAACDERLRTGSRRCDCQLVLTCLVVFYPTHVHPSDVRWVRGYRMTTREDDEGKRTLYSGMESSETRTELLLCHIVGGEEAQAVMGRRLEEWPFPESVEHAAHCRGRTRIACA